VLACAAAVSACSNGAGTPSPTPTGSGLSPSLPTATSTLSGNPTPSLTGGSETPDPLAGWTLEQKVGQLFMVGVDVTAPKSASYDAITTYHVGNAFLAGRTRAGIGAVQTLVATLTVRVTAAATHNTPLFVATDQEGGLVQVLQGPGFDTIPSAMDQATLSPAELQQDATTWGSELARAGVNLNLAPVMDLVPSAADAPKNPPIGYFHRNYGFTPDDVTSHANAFSAGMGAAGVAVTIKHFPGLGRVTENTDTTAGVTDDVTTRDDASVSVFHSGIDAGAPFVMMSTAIYSLIDDDAPAAFSPVVVGQVLRGDLGFGGVVITDDVSAAKQVQAWSPGDRAVNAIAAGCAMVLASADPSVIAAMVRAVVARAQADPAFAAQVDASVSRVLAAKAAWLT
jgi:beta-N-acetylhexosaminidase